jgi:uncharacterized membrane protein
MINLTGRLRNYGFLVSVVSFVLSLLVQGGVIDLGTSDHINTVITAILDFLVFLGIVNNPTTQSKGFLDDHPSTTSAAPVGQVTSLSKPKLEITPTDEQP